MYIYAWGNNEKRASMKGRSCEVIARQAGKEKVKSVLIRFKNGQKEITSIRALRKSIVCHNCQLDKSVIST